MSNLVSWKILKGFSSKNTFGFSFQDVVSEFPGTNPSYLGRILSCMVEEGLLLKIARDTYHIIPMRENPYTYTPQWPQVAKYFMGRKAYYIGYASAMEILGLAEIRGPNEYVVTNLQVKPSVRKFGEYTFRFIRHDFYRFFGFDCMWINMMEKAMVSDVEKTIVDIATKPGLGGGIERVGHALFHAQNRIDMDKLFYYFARNRISSAKKRFLYLTGLLEMDWTSDHDRMMKKLSSGISLLDPSQPDQCIGRHQFGLKINVDPVVLRKKALRPAW